MIVTILGKSGTGKTKIFNNVKEKMKLNGLIQYTTRPPREGEVDGVSYNFIDNDEFLDLVENSMLATSTSFTVANGELWCYGYAKDHFKNGEDCILVVNPHEYGQLKNLYGDKVVSILIDATLQTRIDRYFDRDKMTKENVKELTRRMIADEKDFENIKFDYVVDNNGFLDDTIKNVIAIINGEIYHKRENIENKTYLYTGTMRSGKSEFLIKKVKNDIRDNIDYLALKPKTDTRTRKITSRNGQSVFCIQFKKDEDLFEFVTNYMKDQCVSQHEEFNIYIDEAQFMTQKQVNELMRLKSYYKNIKIFCYGLLIDFKNTYFDATDLMVKHFDKVIKIPYLCEKCGIENATNHILKINGRPVVFGDNVAIEGENTEYECVCFNCYNKYLNK